VEKILEKDVEERENITTDMERLAKGMKEMASQAHVRIVADSPNIDRMAKVMSANVDQTGHTNRILKEIIGDSKNSTLIYYILSLIVIIVFVLMFAYIKTWKK